MDRGRCAQNAIISAARRLSSPSNLARNPPVPAAEHPPVGHRAALDIEALGGVSQGDLKPHASALTDHPGGRNKEGHHSALGFRCDQQGAAGPVLD